MFITVFTKAQFISIQLTLPRSIMFLEDPLLYYPPIFAYVFQPSALLYVGVQINFYPHFPHVLSNLHSSLIGCSVSWQASGKTVFLLRTYSWSNFTKSPALGAGIVSELSLTLQAERMREVVCAQFSVFLQSERWGCQYWSAYVAAAVMCLR